MRALPLILIASTALARELPNFDAFLDSTATRSLGDGSAFDGHVSGLEERLGVPTFFWAAPPAAGTRSFRDQGLSVEQAARRHLFTHAGLYRARPAQLAEATLVRLHDTGQGAIIATFEKRVNGVSVFRDRLNVAMNQRLELVALTGYLSPAAVKASDFKLTAPTAFASAWFDLTGTPVESLRFLEGAPDEAGFLRFTSTLEQPFSGRAKKVFYPLPERLIPAWHLELDLGAHGSTSSEQYAVVISAENGAVLSRKNLTEAEQFTYRVWAENSGLFLPHDGPQGVTVSPHPTGTPNGFDPPFVQPALVTLQNGPISTNDPWLAPNATETTGNNVDAYADLASPDGFGSGDLRATTTSTRTFDRTYDPSLAPNVNAAQQQAGVTQLFFDINQLHDWFYDRGFNEAAGNAQANNFSRGGAGNDSIRAEAQDFAGTDNANMSTPADGARPRMQMYVWVPSALTTLSAAPGGPYPSGSAGFGASAFNLTAQAVLAVDGTAPVNDGCTALTGSVTGRVVVVDRGSCTFGRKALNAQTAGAVGVIIVDNQTSSTPPFLAADTSINNVTIPVLSVTQADGNAIKSNLTAGTVSVTMTRTAVVRRAGELDNTIVAHEWGHYLSNRLISDAAGLTNNQGRSMGEGWSDTIAMLLIVRDGDQQLSANANFGGVYAASTYAMGGPGFPDATYFGIRRYPYSTDLTKNPLTFRHVENGVALPAGVPASSGGASNAEVHNSGELWAVTLWECYAALLRDTTRLTFDQARDRFMRYLVAGLKLTPAQPTFTEARDAILAAAAANDVLDFQLFATAFAKRGLGLRAVAPSRSSTNHAGVVEDFTLGSELTFVGATLDDEARYCDRDGVLDSGELGNLRVTLRNAGTTTLSAITGRVTSSTQGVLFLNPNLTFTSALPFAQSTGSTQVALIGATAPTEIVINLEFNDPQLMSATPRTATLRFRVHTDAVPTSSATDDAETNITAWTFTKDTALSTAFDWRRKIISSSQAVWFGVDPGGNADISLVSPPLNVAASGNLGLVLNHRWDFEADATTNYDGAVIEVSTNGGTSWTDIGTSAAGYTGTLGGSGSNNPLVNRSAFTGRSPNYPSFETDTLNLGSSYAGQTIRVRLRIGSDQAAAGAGWDVDSIGFTGITNTPFPSLVADRGICINRPPIADAGPNLAVDERTQVTLTSAASSDPDADMLTAAWTQTAGPAVTIVNGVFTAPEVTTDTLITFELVVNDGTVNSAPDTVEVLVLQVNRAPVASAGPAMQVNEGATITLAGTGLDPDGDTLTASWTQVAGPMGTFSDATSATSQFTAPMIGATSVHLTLELVVSDGSRTSASQLDVEVLPLNDGPSVTIIVPARVAESSNVVMSAVGVDPDGDALSYSWRQTNGAPVALITPNAASASFIAPEVTEETPLTFEVTVSDGAAMRSASGTVVITNANRTPIVVIAPGAREAKEGTVVQLDASGSSDPDGDAMTFAWAQTAGNPLVIEGSTSSVASFTMPKEGTLTFTVTVTDSAGASALEAVTFTSIGGPKGCGCTSSEGLFFLVLPLLLTLRRRRSGKCALTTA